MVDKDFIALKKNHFLKIVHNTSRNLKIRVTPTVVFWDTSCPEKSNDELAHIHVDKAQICVSLKILKTLNLDDIEQVATHEVSHMVYADHSTNFQKTNERASISNFSPGPGVVRVGDYSNLQKSKSSKRKTTKKDTSECSYYSCKNKTNLSKCLYCNKHFCKIHIRAVAPTMPNFDRVTTAFDHLRAREAQKDDCHPCPDYVDYLSKESKILRTETSKESAVAPTMPNFDRVTTTYDHLTSECSYYSCKNKTNLSKCLYCNKHFCKIHIRAVAPTMPNFDRVTTAYDHLRAREAQKDDCHPCPNYVDYLSKESKILRTEPSNGLLNNCGSTIDDNLSRKEAKSKKLQLAFISIIIIILVITLFYYVYKLTSVGNFQIVTNDSVEIHPNEYILENISICNKIKPENNLLTCQGQCNVVVNYSCNEANKLICVCR